MKIEGDQSIYAFVNDRGDATWAGLTYRQYFAGIAMQGLMANSSGMINVKSDAKTAVEAADAIIAELNKTEEKNVQGT